MDSYVSKPVSNRRAFLRTVLPGGALLCLGGRCLLAAPQTEEKAQETGQKHKFLKDSGMSFAEVFKTAYADQMPIWRRLEQEIGSKKFFVMMKGIVDELVKKEMLEYAKKLGKNDLAAYTQELRRPSGLMQNALTYQIIEDTPQAFELKIAECLWAKSIREANAGDLGYVLMCYGDFAAARAFNPKMRMIRTKTLMQGDEFCNHRYVIEG